MTLSKPISDIIESRYSCRSFRKESIKQDIKERFEIDLSNINKGPLGTPVRFCLTAAADESHNELRGLGTYGFIKDPAGFVIGAAQFSDHYLEDFGYVLEQHVFLATDLGLGTCWLGGTYTKGNFAKKIKLGQEERMPAVLAIGYPSSSDDEGQGSLRKRIGGNRRLAWETLFYDSTFLNPIRREEAGPYAIPLEMVRLAPSASNKQPWRIVKTGLDWHFFLQRTPGYLGGNIGKFIGLEDLQRVDMGIAMCHFERTAGEFGLQGEWLFKEPGIEKTGNGLEYILTWKND